MTRAMPSAATADDRQQGPHIDSRWPVAGSGKNRRRRIAEVEGIADQRRDAVAIEHQKGEAADEAVVPPKPPERVRVGAGDPRDRDRRRQGDTHPGFAMT
jgi:hypothetical protein